VERRCTSGRPGCFRPCPSELLGHGYPLRLSFATTIKETPSTGKGPRALGHPSRTRPLRPAASWRSQCIRQNDLFRMRQVTNAGYAVDAPNGGAPRQVGPLIQSVKRGRLTPGRQSHRNVSPAVLALFRVLAGASEPSSHRSGARTGTLRHSERSITIVGHGALPRR
jgi:hypothetical protein